MVEPDELQGPRPGDPLRRRRRPCSWPCWWPGLVASQLGASLSDLFPGPRSRSASCSVPRPSSWSGCIDDVRDMSAPAKVAGRGARRHGPRISGRHDVPVQGPVGRASFVLSPDVTPLLTALWVIVITNAVNLIDGLDGLATGIVAIASGALAIYGLRLVCTWGTSHPTTWDRSSQWSPSGSASASCPTTSTRPASSWVTPGRCSSGLLMAASTMLIGGRHPRRERLTDLLLLRTALHPVLHPGVPIVDMAFAFVRRTAKRHRIPHSGQEPPAPPAAAPRPRPPPHGRSSCGPGRRCCPAFIALPAVVYKRANAVIPFGVIVLGVVLYTLFHPGLRKDTVNGNGVHGHSRGNGTVPSSPGPNRGARRQTDPNAMGSVRSTPTHLARAAGRMSLLWARPLRLSRDLLESAHSRWFGPVRRATADSGLIEMAERVPRAPPSG